MAYVSSFFGAINTEKSQKKSERYPKIPKKINKHRKPQINTGKFQKIPENPNKNPIKSNKFKQIYFTYLVDIHDPCL